MAGYTPVIVFDLISRHPECQFFCIVSSMIFEML